jgi:GT2 family glycosyltransferase
MISASIVVYKNKPDVLSRTVESYLRATRNGPLYIIDNSPTNEARSICRHPRIVYHFNAANMGYGKGHNFALSKSIDNSKYHLVLNPDVYFEPHVLDELLSYLERNNDVGLIMPNVVYPNGLLQPLCKLLPTPHRMLVRRFLPILKNTVAKINHEYEMQFTHYNKITEAPFLSGCFMLLRTEALRVAGLFDEKFFLYFEDTDLSRRIHQHFKTIFYPDVSIQHIHERGSHKEFRLFWHSIKSGIQYFNKWGWFTDAEREKINRKILIRFNVNGYAHSTLTSSTQRIN